jgi:hypothetical protein
LSFLWELALNFSTPHLSLSFQEREALEVGLRGHK